MSTKKKASKTNSPIGSDGDTSVAEGRVREQDLPEMVGAGVEKKTVPEIENAANEYVDVRDKRRSILEEEIKLKAELLAAMHKAGVKVYEFDGKVVTIKPKDATENVAVKVKKEVEVEEEDSE